MSFRVYRLCLLFLLAMATAEHAGASCNQIPGTSNSFRGSLGSLDRPFASPGELVSVRLSPACDKESLGFASGLAPVVSVVFTPLAGPRTMLVLAPSCSAIESQRQQCVARPDLERVVCVATSASNTIQVIDPHLLRFAFPDTDALLGQANDDRTLAGPATIAISAASDPLPCGLAAQSCREATGLLACVDTLFTVDGTCGTSADATFGHFTALPPANDYQALCTSPVPPCTGTATEFRFALDRDGNILIPMDWRGILAGKGIPIARQLRTTFAGPAFPGTTRAIRLPGSTFLSSYSPEGGLLPPIFEPQTDPTAANELVLFGTADAATTVLRLARRSPLRRQCEGGRYQNAPCTQDSDCHGGSCGRGTCQGGSQAGSICRDDDNCPGGECGTSNFDFATRSLEGIGPVVLPRFAPGVCQDTGVACTEDRECDTSRCVAYRVTAKDPVPLEGLIQSEQLLVTVVPEAIDGRDLNGDGDTTDDTVLLTDRHSGESAAIGESEAPGKAATRLRRSPFSYPAVVASGDLVAFLEAEPLQRDSDINGDGDRFDTILRVYRHGAGGTTELTGGLDLAVDAAPLINGRSIEISNGLVFFRRHEAAAAPRRITRVSVDANGDAANGHANRPSLSKDGKHVAFESSAANLDTAVPLPGEPTSFVHDRRSRQTIRVELPNAIVAGTSAARTPWISSDGRFVAVSALARNGWRQALVYDRDSDGNSIFDEIGRVTASVVSRQGNGRGGSEAATEGDSLFPALSADGRFALFSTTAPYLDFFHTAFHGALIRNDRDPLRLGLFDQAPPAEVNRAATLTGIGEAGHHQPLQAAAISDDGSVVAFTSFDRNLPFRDLNDFCLNLDISGANGVTCADILVRHMTAETTELASVSSSGEQSNNQSLSPALSADGNIVVFESAATNLVAGDTNSGFDVFVRERDVGVTSRVSVSSSGEQANAPSFGRHLSLSDDGRFVAFASRASNLVPDDANDSCLTADGQGLENCADIFVHDRLTGFTERVSKLGSVEADGRSGWPSLSGDGSTVAFESRATNLVSGGSECADGPCASILVSEPDAVAAVDRNGDGDGDDTLLEVVDSLRPERGPTVLGPAQAVAVADGRAVFLVPEAQAGSDLNADGDRADLVVHLAAAGQVRNLGRAAEEVAISSTVIGARVSEAEQGDLDLNQDGDSVDTVVAVWPLAQAQWRDLGVAADALVVSDSDVVLRVPEDEQGADLNNDGDNDDFVLQVYSVSTGSSRSLGEAVEDFVVGHGIVAMRTSEAAQGNRDKNGDEDTLDSVLQVYDIARQELVNTEQAAVACRLPACDPRVPYRITASGVKFLTLEEEQEEDLNADGDRSDLVLQTFHTAMARTGLQQARAGGDAIGRMRASRTRRRADVLQAGALTTIGAVGAGVCTDSGRACAAAADCGSSGGRCFTPPGACVEKLNRSCDTALAGETCGEGEFCVPSLVPGKGFCHVQHGPCASDGDCTAPARCQDSGESVQRLASPLAAEESGHVFVAACDSAREGDCASPLLIAAAGDADEDGIADPFDNCARLVNTNQEDRNGNGVGDVCETVSPNPTPSATAPAPQPSPAAPGRSGGGCSLVASSDSSLQAIVFAAGLLVRHLRRRRMLGATSCVMVLVSLLNARLVTAQCAGDCDGSGLVDVVDVIRMQAGGCDPMAGDPLRVVQAALAGCDTAPSREDWESLLFILARIPHLQGLFAAAIGGAGGSGDCELGGLHTARCVDGADDRVEVHIAAETCAARTIEASSYLDGTMVLVGSGLCPHLLVPDSIALEFQIDSRIQAPDGSALSSAQVEATALIEGFIFDRPPCRVRGGSGNISGSIRFEAGGVVRRVEATKLRMAFESSQFQLNPTCEPGTIRATLDGGLRIEGISGQMLSVRAQGLRVTRNRLNNTVEVEGALVADRLGGEVALRTIEPLRVPLGTPCPSGGAIEYVANGVTREIRFNPQTVCEL